MVFFKKAFHVVVETNIPGVLKDATGPLPGGYEKNPHFGLQFTFETKLTKSAGVSK